MHKLLIKLATLILFVVMPLAANNAYGQDQPKNEVFGGYCYLRSDFSANSNGFQVALTRYVTKNLGVTLEGSQLYNRDEFRSDIFRTKFSTNITTLLIGPKYAFHNRSRFTPYAQALIGGYRITNESFFSSPAFRFNSTGKLISLSTSFGGGLDIKLNEKISIRAAQVDYLFLRQVFSSHKTRVSTGIVFHFGK